MHNKGNRVILVDSDPQGSARDWSAVNENNPVTVIGIDRPTIDRDIKAIQGKEFIVIDGAPQASNLAISAIKASDFILIPVQPSPYDIWATSDLVDLVKQRIEMMDGKLKAAFVVSRAITGTKIGNEINEALEGYDLPILKTRITQRGMATQNQTFFIRSERSPSLLACSTLKRKILFMMKSRDIMYATKMHIFLDLAHTKGYTKLNAKF